MTEELQGTNLEKEKGADEFAEVEKLIAETLAETKVSKKEPATETKKDPEITKKDSFTATSFKPEPKTQKQETVKAKQPITTKVAAPAATPQEKYEATFKEYKVADIVKGTVMKVDPSGILVDINYKADGLILIEELSEKSSTPINEQVKVGDKIDVFIENLENKEGYVVLSKKRADEEVTWKKAFDSYKKKTLLEGKVMQALKGGLLVDCNGLRGFVPASQVVRQAGESLETFKDKVLPLKVIELNRRQGKIVLSHKLGASAQKRDESSKIINEIEVGQVRKGRVANLKTFGAFVDLGGIEGLIHLSELSWKRVKHPSEVVKSGQEIDVFILGVDRVNKKISLGLKELQEDPWAAATDHYKPGQIVKAKILRFAKFGAFAELDHNLEGLIHISEMSKERIETPDQATKINDVVDVKILRIVPDEQKIGLSMKAVIIQREKEEMKKHLPQAPENKVTLGDMIAQKEKDRAEKEEEFEEEVEEVTETPEVATPTSEAPSAPPAEEEEPT